MIPVDALQSSYNSVLQDGISSIDSAVDDTVAALSHLKEVRDAVAKLGQDKPHRNKSLLNTMDRTMSLQQELELALQKMIQVVNAKGTNSNRRLSTDSSRSEVSRGVSKGDSNSESSAESEDKPIATSARLQLGRERGGNDELRKRNGEFQNENQKRIRLTSENATSAGSSRILNLLPPVEEEKTPLRPIEIVECTEDNVVDGLKTSGQYLGMMRKLAKMSAIKRYAHTREVLQEIADVVDKYGKTRLREEHAVILVRTVMMWPLRDNTDQKSLMDVYQRFLKSMEAYEGQMVNKNDRAQLKSLIPNLSWVLKELESCVSNNEQLKGPAGGAQSQPPVVSAAKPLPSSSSEEQQHAATYTTLIKNGKQMPIRSRLQVIPRILFLLKDGMVTDEAGAQKSAIADSIEELLKWIVKGSKVWQDLGAYQVFAVILSSYAEQHFELEKLKRVADQFSKTIDKLRLESSGGKIVHADSRQGTDNVQPATLMRGALEEKKGKGTNTNENERESGKRSSPRLELTKGNCLEKLRMMTQVSVAGRRQHLPDMLTKLTDIVLVSKKQEQLPILKYVLLWAKLSAGSGDDMIAYDRFCKAMATIINKSPEGGRKAGLERLNNSLLAMLKEHEAKNTETPTKMSISYDLMVFRVNAMAPGERVKHIPEVFNSLKKEMSRGAEATNIHEILNSLKTVKQWADYVPEGSNFRQLYGDLAEQIELYNRGVSMFYAKVSLTRYVVYYASLLIL
ncbi:hypothetical protein V7S43_001851 [Phytophthora oleae]|uniref:Uncharacterized protein n=1 Tax=Phytophthora oleae TaxID=2107226 RepID=A0ABD3G094_9STRA